MDIYEILDKYRSQSVITRVILIFIVSLCANYLYFENEIMLLEADLDSARRRSKAAEVKFLKAQKKISQLTGLSSELEVIKRELSIVRKVLPDKLEINNILASVGDLEDEYNVLVKKFEPKEEEDNYVDGEYIEHFIDIHVHGKYSQVMLFLDGLVHLPNLTHLRGVKIVGVTEQKENADRITTVDAQAKLILFRGVL